MVCRGKEASSLALGRSPASDRPVTGIAGYFGVASIKFWLGLRDKRTSPINRTRNHIHMPLPSVLPVVRVGGCLEQSHDGKTLVDEKSIYSNRAH